MEKDKGLLLLLLLAKHEKREGKRGAATAGFSIPFPLGLVFGHESRRSTPCRYEHKNRARKEYFSPQMPKTKKEGGKHFHNAKWAEPEAGET